MIIVCAIFVVVGILSIIFFGGGGLFYVVSMSWKPIAVISSKGIMVPYGWGKNFVPWENVDRFEVVEQTVRSKGYTQKIKYIGIFVNDKKDIVGAGEISQAIVQNIIG